MCFGDGFLQYSINLKSSFSSLLKFHKKNYYNRYYDIPSKIEIIILQSYIFTVFSEFNIMAFKRVLNLS